MNKKKVFLHLQKAIQYYNQKQYKNAELLYENILQQINFVFPEIYIGYGNTLLKLQKYEKSIKNFKKSLELKKDLHESYFGLAIAYEKCTKYNKSIEFYKKTIRVNKSFMPAYNNLANLYQNLFQYKKAHKLYKKALTLDVHSNILLDNIATLFQNQDKYKKAIAYHKLALGQNNATPVMYYNYSLALLMKGNIELGFKYYEHRLQLTKNISQILPSSNKWKGTTIKGKKLFIFTEQGFGDSIQFIRYISYIKKTSKAIILLKCPGILIPLFRNIEEIDFFIEDSILPSFDYYLPLMSSGYALQHTLSSIPYRLPCLNSKKRPLLSASVHSRFKIGLAWSGSEHNSNNHLRSIAIENFKELFTLTHCQFYSLQKDHTCQKTLSKYNIINPMEEVNDFSDTAGYIMDLDLIISIDSVIAHLSLALGKPTWVLLGNASDYRWSQNKSSTTWYPKAIIYKKKKKEKTWENILNRVKIDLLKLPL